MAAQASHAALAGKAHRRRTTTAATSRARPQRAGALSAQRCQPSMVSQLERGPTTPSLQTLKRVAEALGVSMLQILPDQSPSAEANLVVLPAPHPPALRHQHHLLYHLLSPT